MVRILDLGDAWNQGAQGWLLFLAQSQCSRIGLAKAGCSRAGGLSVDTEAGAPGAGKDNGVHMPTDPTARASCSL